jgi:hypothetical protein
MGKASLTSRKEYWNNCFFRLAKTQLFMSEFKISLNI